MAADRTLIVVSGPTAVGKTALAIELAKHFSTDVISADSRQFFREMNIGTAKPDPEELAQVPHHFINSHNIQTLFSTGDFEVQALRLMDELFQEKNVLILAGGSGLYIDAICKGLDELPATDPDIRQQLNHLFADQGIEPIKTQLSELDPEYYQKVDQFNPQRMIRGLEFVLSTGKKLSSFLTSSKKERPFRMIKIGLNMDRSLLYQRINARVDLMMDKGLLNEVRGLQDYRQYNALNTVGYSELFDYLEGNCALETAVDRIKQNTRRFAKRQLTWFRRDEDITWFEPDQTEMILAHINERLNIRD
ncbi:MAG: tRNA (adenosine(37)-N6)-dimethylallyltransferase MiaA [Bacteroidota bacterium]